MVYNKPYLNFKEDRISGPFFYMYNQTLYMVKPNTSKKPPKGSVRFSLTLSEEQKSAKQAILHHPYNFIVGKAGSGKTLLASQIALDVFFKRHKLFSNS